MVSLIEIPDFLVKEIVIIANRDFGRLETSESTENLFCSQFQKLAHLSRVGNLGTLDPSSSSDVACPVP